MGEIAPCKMSEADCCSHCHARKKRVSEPSHNWLWVCSLFEKRFFRRSMLSGTKPKSMPFSRAWHRMHCFALSSDWFIVLFLCLLWLAGCDSFGFGFSHEKSGRDWSIGQIRIHLFSVRLNLLASSTPPGERGASLVILSQPLDGFLFGVPEFTPPSFANTQLVSLLLLSVPLLSLFIYLLQYNECLWTLS